MKLELRWKFFHARRVAGAVLEPDKSAPIALGIQQNLHSFKDMLEVAAIQDIVQDFEFNVASSRVRISANGEHVMATGIYAPEHSRCFWSLFQLFSILHSCAVNCERLKSDVKSLHFGIATSPSHMCANLPSEAVSTQRARSFASST